MIEAAPEDLELKRRLFAELAEACGPEAILATNTSSLPVTAIAAETPGRERVVGMHFFNPPALMKLVEVVATADSSEEALAATTEVGRRMGRTPIRAKDSPGFIANRLARPFSLESLRMLADGVADAETIDRACRLGGGFRMGPFELIDLIGLDVNLSVARSFYAQGGEPERWRPSEIQERMVGEGRLGRKSGRGFYAYDGGGATAARTTPISADHGADPRPGRAGEDRPGGAGDRPPPGRADRQRGRLRARRGGRLARGHEHRDAARLQLAARPGRVHRADRGRAGGRAARAAAQATTATPTGPRPACSPGPRELSVGSGRKPASEHTAASNREARARCRPTTRSNRRRPAAGWSPPSTPRRIESESGRTVWELESYDFLEGEEPPDTAHPGLWRLAGLNRIAGLFELAPGFFQLRGFDLSNMHVIEGEDGNRRHRPAGLGRGGGRGPRPLPRAPWRAAGHRPRLHPQPRRPLRRRPRGRQRRGDRGREIPVLAPAGFLHHAVSENVFAGTAMGRRAGYMYGALLGAAPTARSARASGMTTSLGTLTLIPPNLEIAETGQEETVDGVRMTLPAHPGDRGAGGDEHPLPRRARPLHRRQRRPLDAQHPHSARRPGPRPAGLGALPRRGDRAASATDSDVLFSGHHWPAWGGERIVDLLEKQRDLYSYLHDQTLRLLNKGLTGPEIAEEIELPPSLAAEWHCREYYGSVSHNVKAIYQRYMGWFDGNPAHLWEHPPVERRAPLRRVHGRRRARCWRRPASRSRRATTAGSPRSSTTSSSPSPSNEEARRAAGRRPRAARLRRRERDLAQLLPDGRQGAARGRLRHPDLNRAAATSSPGSRSSSSSTRWRSASTGPRAWGAACGSTGW